MIHCRRSRLPGNAARAGALRTLGASAGALFLGSCAATRSGRRVLGPQPAHRMLDRAMRLQSDAAQASPLPAARDMPRNARHQRRGGGRDGHGQPAPVRQPLPVRWTPPCLRAIACRACRMVALAAPPWCWSRLPTARWCASSGQRNAARPEMFAVVPAADHHRLLHHRRLLCCPGAPASGIVGWFPIVAVLLSRAIAHFHRRA